MEDERMTVSPESQLRSVMESLEIEVSQSPCSSLENSMNESIPLESTDAEPQPARMSLRRRSINLSQPSANRRVMTKPKKREQTPVASSVQTDIPKEITKLYLNSKLKLTSRSLETIYEDPKLKVNGMLFLGSRKIKRCLAFNGSTPNPITKAKLKKRRDKIKKFFLGKTDRKKNKKLTQEQFLKKVQEMNSDE